ncbi:homoserine kinase [Streptococcus pacificus]|uniref:Homoserine kinase n=1 Tax=Streptococcus pacificus TaxID=2740577 RepID=A0ABS0ZHB2_9STRE|nr:homoserine kinase [Streptococcus pacificus]MBJ8325386.1 homoserine kinase [Streptococcus pacificus]
MKIIVPATSANLGPGFDSIGLAVTKYLEVTVIEASRTWEVLHDLTDIPTDESNLLIQIALKVNKNLTPHRIQMTSDIPLARGLGSSSSVIVAGIELANQLGEMKLSLDEKLRLASLFEGHPDNVAPAIFGNLVVASDNDYFSGYTVSPFPSCRLLAFIPNYELKTSDSRNSLPETLEYTQAVAASAIANVAVSALVKGDLVTAGKAMSSDLFHEPYRQKLVPEFQKIKELAKQFGAYTTYLSGAGPTIMTILDDKNAKKMKEAVDDLRLNGEAIILDVDTKGLQVI